MKINIEKLKSYFGTNTAIHCDTEEKAKILLRTLYDLKWMWIGDVYLELGDRYETYDNQTCYSLEYDARLSYCALDWFKKNNYNIITFDDLLFIKNAEPDQSCKQDDGKPKLSLVPTQIIRDIAEVREYGNNKYGESESWRRVEPQRYIDALLRHTLEFVSDTNSVDAESGIQHLKHMAANVAFLCEMFKEA